MVVVTFHIPAFQSYAVIKPHQESLEIYGGAGGGAGLLFADPGPGLIP
jgi:hypothetical protein